MKRDKAAYPGYHNIGNAQPVPQWQSGMTRREVFAKAAMEGLIARPENDDLKTVNDWFARQESVACAAVGYADALIAELDKEEN